MSGPLRRWVNSSTSLAYFLGESKQREQLWLASLYLTSEITSLWAHIVCLLQRKLLPEQVWTVAEASKSLNLRPVWSTWQVPDQPRLQVKPYPPHPTNNNNKASFLSLSLEWVLSPASISSSDKLPWMCLQILLHHSSSRRLHLQTGSLHLLLQAHQPQPLLSLEDAGASTPTTSWNGDGKTCVSASLVFFWDLFFP